MKIFKVLASAVLALSVMGSTFVPAMAEETCDCHDHVAVHEEEVTRGKKAICPICGSECDWNGQYFECPIDGPLGVIE